MEWLFSNWRSLAIAFGAGFVLAIIAAIFVHNWDVDRLQAKWQDETTAKVEAAEAAIIGRYKQANNAGEIIGNDLQASYSITGAELKRLRGIAPTKCVCPASKAVQCNGTSTTGLSEQDGYTVGPFLDLGAECDDRVNQLTACQRSLEAVYKANGQ